MADLLGLGTAAPAFAAILPTAVEASKGMRMRGGWEADGRRVGGGQAAYGKRIGEGSEEAGSWVGGKWEVGGKPDVGIRL